VFTPFHKPPYPYLYGRSVDETMIGGFGIVAKICTFTDNACAGHVGLAKDIDWKRDDGCILGEGATTVSQYLLHLQGLCSDRP
jgi:hypothetical protein